VSPAPYKPGRDDTRFGRLARELHAETAAYLAACAHLPDLELSADLNELLRGRWAVWFEATTGSSTLWRARRTSGGRLLTADSSTGLLAAIEEEEDT
jgi:hypothetical protein